MSSLIDRIRAKQREKTQRPEPPPPGPEQDRWLASRGLTYLLVPRLQKLLDDAWQLELDQSQGGCGDAAEDARLRQLADELSSCCVAVVAQLGARAFVARSSTVVKRSR